MGLAEPRKRLKISHDPRNLTWSSQSATTSYGHRLMAQQGWSEGQALGARDSSSTSSKPQEHHSGLATDAERLAAARVGILFKDDNLGLGAKRKGGRSAQDVEGQRTGLDAFQGLLGRLNGKDEGLLVQEERRVEERKLEMFFRGRWGGMVFVRGGVLVGSQKEEEKGEESSEEVAERDVQENVSEDSIEEEDKEKRQKRTLKEERRLRKEARRERRDEKALKKARKEAKRKAEAVSSSESNADVQLPATMPTRKRPTSHPPDEPLSSAPSEDEVDTSKKSTTSKRHADLLKVEAESEQSRPSSPSIVALKNGRHLLRGRNILAKRMFLDDTKGLDQIFMR